MTTEQARIAALKRYGILDTPDEKQFDDIVKLASQICGTPISLISLVDEDRQWFKAKVGIDALETPRDISVCQYAILGEEVMIISDTKQDERFMHNPLVTGDPHMRFYAGAPLRAPDGHIIGTVCVLDTQPRNLSEDQISALRVLAAQVVTLLELRKALRMQQIVSEELHEARQIADAANMAKSEFLANMSHEIRTPMNAIIGLSSILALSEPLTDKQRMFIETLQLSADSLLSLINDLLDISKIEARSLELESIPFSLMQVAQEVVSMMSLKADEKKLDFSLQEEDMATAQFLGDPSRLRQILLNLCSNAIKFTQAGSVLIAMRTERSETPGMEDVCIEVRDTGIGIAPDKLEAIFEKFVQADASVSRQYGGTGLGLAITRTLIELMGGTILAQSDMGQGSAFTVRIPMKRLQDSTLGYVRHASAKASASQPSVPRILLVEDHEPNILVATHTLHALGYECDTARNGAAAVEMSADPVYQAILMDVQMPGMSGLEATTLIREREQVENTGHIPIIGMTAHALIGDRERCIAAGMDEYISKPFNLSELERKLAELLRAEKESAA